MNKCLFTIEVHASELLAGVLSKLCHEAQQTVPPATSPQATAPPAPAATPPTAAVDAAPPSLDDVRRLMSEMQKQHGTSAVVEVLQRFDAKKLSDLADDALADVAAEVQGRLAS